MTSPPEQAVPGAGGVVLNRAGQVLLVRYRSGGWAFPKGHIEPGETLEQTAEREVHEEGGVHASIIRPLSTTRYTNSRGEPRAIHWFLMSTEAQEVQLEDTFGEGGFFGPEQALGMLSYPHDQELLREALAAS
ncbi:NUDIX hydrolase [Deinococcus sonorensis]|uniref:NUDIX hydrolase n=2 Tax=Deinococcus sonorensis TaxID=309891 RepID=A0AAU7U8M7_9DEIO